MFLNPSVFNRLMKQAYKSYLYMAREGDWLYVAGSYWEASILEKYIPKKTKGDMVALAGELPESGQRRRMNKDEDQFEMDYRMNIDIMPFQNAAELEITDVILQDNNLLQRVLQNVDTGEQVLIADVFTDLVDNRQIMEEDGEYAVEKPLYSPSHGILWANNVCRLNIWTIKADGRNKKIMDALKGLDLMPDMMEQGE